MKSETQYLKAKFHNDMEYQYRVAKTEIKGWNPTRFYQMLNKNGGYETAIKLLSTEASVGFVKLLMRNKLHLSVEYLILYGSNGKYKTLFKPEIIKECENRLKLQKPRYQPAA